MSYCRFSCDDFRSDFYVYANVSGDWTIHVAASRYRIMPPPAYEYPEEHRIWDETRTCFSLSKAGVKAWSKWVDENLATDPIDLPHAGEEFNLPSPGAAADKLEELAALGYHLPDYVIPALRADQEAIDQGEEI